MKEQFITACSLDCPDTCSLLVETENGRIVKVTGNPDHPVTKGAICHKVRHTPDKLYHPDRILYPLKRIGAKGEGKFARISWDEAYAEIAGKFSTIIEEYGAQAILPYSFYGNMGIINTEGMDRRFFHRLGATQLERTICNAAGSTGYMYTMGRSAGIDPEDTVHSKLIIVWGCNMLSTNMHQAVFANEARKKGAKIVVIDVHENRTAKWADWFIPIQPGSDAALALGIMHVLMEENLLDEAFISQYTTGFAELKEEAKAYTPEKVSAITGVPAADIVELARMYGRTTPSYIRIGNGLQHHDNGGMAVRAISCLPALTGQWQHLGGGAMKGNSSFSSTNSFLLERPDLMPNPAPRKVNMNQLGRVLLEESNPPVKAMFVYNCNPAQVAPEQSKVVQGMLREDLFTVVHELFMTDTAKYADIVLPATSTFENLDLYASYWHLYMSLGEPIIPPQGEAKSNFTLFKELAAHMGFTEPCFSDTEEDLIRQALDNPDNPHLLGITYEALKEKKWLRLHTEGIVPAYKNPPTPSGKIELFSAALEQQGLSPVPVHTPLADNQYPLRFVPAPNHQFLNSTMANLPKLQQLEKRPEVYLHKDDAAARGIAGGDLVELWNDRGSCRLHANVGTAVLPGVAVTQGLWWSDAETGYTSVNALTPDSLSDIGRGATFFSGTVDVRKI
ncbi:molybdopterin-containing oxidoreductase family protein [Ectobacillus ponti]|uniref:Molybdopterin oxidoreductase family protein n=1 Tax=Ectobacillus ponti TaxID=2961894 RepID=A0AA41X6E9_9BACI|nr:molybdopterin oxidoreductase family protein [Ectobacillus ponti]MCP8969562.1 molybdopterin oxidoreductase family protein [Ectobacillus ponti]